MERSMIRFSCPLCGKALKAVDDAIGRTGRCTKCGTPCIVPRISVRTKAAPLSMPEFTLPPELDRT